MVQLYKCNSDEVQHLQKEQQWRLVNGALVEGMGYGSPYNIDDNYVVRPSSTISYSFIGHDFINLKNTNWD